jgi:NAD(P)-dependent dehydrogenase (short-subunit alcohol dehydrogenase family)
LSQNVLVTGGADGIGRAISERFLAAGAQVHVCDVNPKHLEAVTSANPTLRGSIADVGDSAAVGRLIGEATEWMGGVDVLVNNVGIAGRRAPLEELSDEDWDSVLRVNLNGMFYTMRALIPAMKKQGGGAIVNISTGSVKTLPVERSIYNVSKAAVEGLTLTMAKELGPSGIRVNAIQPGMVNNERMRGIVQRIADQEGRSYEDVESGFLDFISMRSKVEPTEIADLAVFLASEAAGHITGQIISVDGNIEWEQ